MATYRSGDRVEWNSISDKWLPATVDRVDVGVLIPIILDGKGQTLAHPDRLRPLGSSAHCEMEGTAAVPDTAEAGELLADAARAAQAANRRRLEQRARDLEHVPDPALKMRLAELIAHRGQCCAGESDCYADWELADLRWVLARRAESAGSTPGATEFGEGAPEHDGPVRDHYGCVWSPSVRPGDGFRGWVHHLPGPGLPPVWLTWGQLTIQRGTLTAADLTALDIPAARR